VADADDIDTEMYLRDGAPHATVCKVELKDGRVGIGIFRQNPKSHGSLSQPAADKAALDDALENVPDPVDEDDLQAQLGQPARA
jgi:hypothetical protein